MHLIRHRVHCEVSKGIADDLVPIGARAWWRRLSEYATRVPLRNVFVYVISEYICNVKSWSGDALWNQWTGWFIFGSDNGLSQSDGKPETMFTYCLMDKLRWDQIRIQNLWFAKIFAIQ